VSDLIRVTLLCRIGEDIAFTNDEEVLAIHHDLSSTTSADSSFNAGAPGPGELGTCTPAGGARPRPDHP
jgi:hypothetical protein